MKKKYLLGLAFALSLTTSMVSAEEGTTGGFDNAAAQDWITSYISPLTDFLIWLVPSVTILASVLAVLKFNSSDEDEKESKKLDKRLKPIIIGGIIGTSIVAFLKIFGI